MRHECQAAECTRSAKTVTPDGYLCRGCASRFAALLADELRREGRL
jgi:hypothetical protein